MHGASVTSLVIVILAAFLTPILLHRLKLNFMPVVVAEIIIGLFIGKSGFNIVHEDMWLETLSMLGFIFLMFLSGLEIDFTAFAGGKKKEKLPSGKNAPNTFLVSTIIFVGIFALSLLLSYIFVWIGLMDNAFLMTLIISTIFAGCSCSYFKRCRHYEIQHWSNYFAGRCYCRFSDNDFTCCFCFYIWRRRKQYMAATHSVWSRCCALLLRENVYESIVH